MLEINTVTAGTGSDDQIRGWHGATLGTCSTSQFVGS